MPRPELNSPVSPLTEGFTPQGASTSRFLNPRRPEIPDRDLYVFVFDFQGKVLSHGSNAKLVGKNLLAIKDSDGKAFVKEFVDVAQGSGEGWVDYKWPNPTTKKVEQKSSFIKRQGDALVGVGIYK